MFKHIPDSSQKQSYFLNICQLLQFNFIKKKFGAFQRHTVEQFFALKNDLRRLKIVWPKGPFFISIISSIRNHSESVGKGIGYYKNFH